MEEEGNANTHTQHKNNNHADRTGVHIYEKGYAYINSTVTTVPIEVAEKEQRKQNAGYDYETEHKPKRSQHR